jgi:tetratricopeptide (TPR) repeat protein
LPRILKAGEAYDLQAILIDPRRKRHVDRIRVTALGREEVLLKAIDKLARQVRTRLGESLKSIEEADKAVIQHTTSLWEALNYLSIGQKKWHEGKFKDAASFFELALEKDPMFVAARGSLGLVLIQFLNQKEKGKQMLKQALKDAKGITQQEYLWVKAINLWYVDGDYEGALNEYEMISELYPDSMQAYNNALALRESGKMEEAEKAAQEGVNELLENVGKKWEAAWVPLIMAKLEIVNGRDDKIDRYISQAKSLGLSDSGALIYLAEVFALTGKNLEAIQTLKKVIEAGHSDPYFLQIYPSFYSLQNNPQFQAIFR